MMAMPARRLMCTVRRGAGCRSMPVGAVIGGTAGLLVLESLAGSILVIPCRPG